VRRVRGERSAPPKALNRTQIWTITSLVYMNGGAGGGPAPLRSQDSDGPITCPSGVAAVRTQINCRYK
jgi:hypothetical protein